MGDGKWIERLGIFGNLEVRIRVETSILCNGGRSVRHNQLSHVILGETPFLASWRRLTSLDSLFACS